MLVLSVSGRKKHVCRTSLHICVVIFLCSMLMWEPFFLGDIYIVLIACN